MPVLELTQLIQDRRLLSLVDKVMQCQRLSFEDGLLLYETPDLTGIGALASHVRTRLHGKKTYFALSQRLSYTNICQTECRFCAFHAALDDTNGYVLSAEEAIANLTIAQQSHQFFQLTAHRSQFAICNVYELHIVGGHNPALKIEYFENLFRAIKSHFPAVHLKVFTMVEIDFYARNSGISVNEFLDRCIAAGLDSCPGGGAEIFAEELRKQICPNKGDANVWLDTAKKCHKKGLSTNCTMLYGHIEKVRHKVDHLLCLRQAQDEAMADGCVGFNAYIPLAFQAEGNELGRQRQLSGTTGVQEIREIAVGRLLLDNIPHIKAYWVMITPELAQIALSYGASDLDGTAVGEEIAHKAGAKTPQGLLPAYLRRLITEAGYEAVER